MRRLVARHAAAALLAALLAALSVAAPLVNAAGGPPRALFLRLPADLPEPRLALSARQGADGAWSLMIAAEGFRFTGICRADAEAAPVGHAHVLLGEVKVASAFAPTVGLGRLGPGLHRVRVLLRAQDHRALVGRNGLIQAEMVIAVPAAATGAG